MPCPRTQHSYLGQRSNPGRSIRNPRAIRNVAPLNVPHEARHPVSSHVRSPLVMFDSGILYFFLRRESDNPPGPQTPDRGGGGATCTRSNSSLASVCYLPAHQQERQELQVSVHLLLYFYISCLAINCRGNCFVFYITVLRVSIFNSLTTAEL